jgi:hypothetical protein
MDPRCRICIFMGKTDPDAAAHRQQSMILVPMDAPGVAVLRPLTVYGYDDAPHGHAEIRFEVRSTLCLFPVCCSVLAPLGNARSARLHAAHTARPAPCPQTLGI